MKIFGAFKYGELSYKSLEVFENSFGVEIPESFRNHLANFNGGIPEFSFFNIKEDVSQIHGPFYGLHSGPYHTRLDLVNSDLKDRLPKSMIAIASDPGGNQICIDTSIENNGEINFWDHSTLKAQWLSTDLNQFLSKLYIWEPLEEGSMEKYIKDNDLKMIELYLLKNSPDTVIELDRTIIEIAAIHNKTDVIRLLHSKGATLRKALEFAKQNAQFFPNHKISVELIKSLYKKE